MEIEETVGAQKYIDGKTNYLALKGWGGPFDRNTFLKKVQFF